MWCKGPARALLAASLAIAMLPSAAADEVFWIGPMPNTSSSSTSVVGTTTSLAGGTMDVIDATGVSTTFTVPGGGSVTWTMSSTLVPTGLYPDRAYRILASEGVFPTYFFPIGATAYSNDAGRMVPGSLLGLDHWIYSYVEPSDPGGPGQEPFILVIATRDGTLVEATVTGAVAGGGGVPAIPMGGSATFTMDDHDILMLRSPADLTGSRIQSDKPVAVYSGNTCAWIGSSACDHISDPVLPADLGGTEYVHCASAVDRAAGYDLLRVTALHPGATTVTFTPAPASLPGGTLTLTGPGDWDGVELVEDVRIVASQEVTVAGYYGKYGSGAAGDPAMVVLTPVDRWSSLRAFYVPPSWNLHATVAAPTTATVELDGTPLPFSRAVPGTAYSCAYTPLTIGTHRIQSTEAVGAHIWATQLYASFWYEASGQMLSTVQWTFDNSYGSCVDSAVRFKDSGSATAPGHEIIRWDWDFGDGTTGTGRDPFHTYATEGVYTVRLTVTDDRGVRRSLIQDVWAPGDPNCPPTVTGPYERTVRATRTTRVCVQANDPDHDPLSYSYGPPDLPDGVLLDQGGRCFSWTPRQDQVGDHGPIVVRVTSAGGEATTMLTIHVLDGLGPLPDDLDQDGVSDRQDNCPSVANTEQDDHDLDGVGDACSDGPVPPVGSGAGGLPPGAAPGDLDGDGVRDEADLCPDAADPGQADLDGDARGDACDADLDGDGVAQVGMAEAFLDNCPRVGNPTQLDGDSDGEGDACEAGPATATAAPAAGATSEAAPRDASGPALGLLLAAALLVARRR